MVENPPWNLHRAAKYLRDWGTDNAHGTQKSGPYFSLERKTETSAGDSVLGDFERFQEFAPDPPKKISVEPGPPGGAKSGPVAKAKAKAKSKPKAKAKAKAKSTPKAKAKGKAKAKAKATGMKRPAATIPVSCLKLNYPESLFCKILNKYALNKINIMYCFQIMVMALS